MKNSFARTWCAVLLCIAGCDGERLGDTDAGREDDAGMIGEDDAGMTGDDAGMDAGPSCVDDDEDGYGEGCALGPDCDDDDDAVSPAADETCNGVDDDCDGEEDEDLVAPSCSLTEGVCAGAVARCRGAEGFAECDATDYGADFEEDEAACDAMDNDCDGTTDEDCPCTDGAMQSCGSDVGACVAGEQTCAGSMWGVCAGETGPMGEVCDGEDNDCDGMEDEAGDLTAPACPLQLGVCAGSTRECGGGAGWIACSGVASYGGDYQRVEDFCDELDNDCDGITDEGCSCVDGTRQACGTDVGACAAGMQTCTAGSWGGCAGEVTPIGETCNGVDDDCDGTQDEDLVAPACALTAGVCAGSTQRCSGEGGFVACTATEYGATYQATEVRCDGLDNDCDGTTDEGCTCIDGRTQPCGSSVGVCTRGTQTCAAGVWGACTGGVLPSAETCNGLDDDCNGSSDDALTPPACALSAGVCTGSVQTCGGASGWIACAGTDSYGPRFLATEPGATDENVCDGLDNDCNGTEDDGCGSGPIANTTNDEVVPSLYNRHLVYSVNFDGNWDVVFQSLTTGEVRRLTTTPQNELHARIYGNYVVWAQESDTATARVFLHDLATRTTTMIGARRSDHPVISGGLVFYEDFDGTQWDVWYYGIASRMNANVFLANTTNELRPSYRGGLLAYMGDDTGTFLVNVVDLTTGTNVTQMPARTSPTGQGSPAIDYLVLGWNDGRDAPSATGMPTDDIDLYGAPFGADGTLNVFPGENAMSTASNGQYLNGVDGSIFVWSDFRSGDWNPHIGTLDGTQLALSSHPATQADPTISGNIVCWEDNRLGNFDVYCSQFGVTNAPMNGYVVINEILADPPAATDVNGDGVNSTTDDEMVEIVNATGIAMNLSGMTLSDATGVRHTFPAGTVLPALGAIVVFGGGTVGATSLHGGAQVQIASSGTLSLNNDGDTLSLRLGTTPIDTVSYGAAANNDESIVRSPEVGTAATFVRHSMMAGAIAGARFTPGTNVGGFGF
jgi:hypothetical protein